MQIIIPMAGQGNRYKRAGYTKIKPLIEVDGKPMIEHVINLFPGESDFLFICASNHLEETNLREVLEKLKPGCPIIGISPHKLGPVHTALEAEEYIRDDVPVVLNYCDFFAYWDYADFKRTMKELDPAGCITAYRGFHPHSLGPNLYAYVRERDNYMLEIREKGCFTDDRMNEYASAGTYYFRKGSLLKHYLKKAKRNDLQINGEYYASTPFNLLLEDDLDVYIYELEHFLQWGTPEDMEEYQAWSDYFAKYRDWKPDLKPSAGCNLIPMAGAGSRFSREGYMMPKPLVPVAGVPMVRRSLESLPAAEKWITLCRTEHLKESDMEQVLKMIDSGARIIPVEKLTEGQACTCLLAREKLDLESPLLIAACDTAVVFDQDKYARMTSDPGIDCLVWTFRNHSHANRNPLQYGWVKTDPDGNVTGISCKVPISDNPRNDPGIIGNFWFRKAKLFTEAADRLIKENRRINNEFYVDSVIDVIVEMGLNARVFDVMYYVCFGTPDDVRTYEYWDSYFSKMQREV